MKAKTQELEGFCSQGEKFLQKFGSIRMDNLQGFMPQAKVCCDCTLARFPLHARPNEGKGMSFIWFYRLYAPELPLSVEVLADGS